MFSTLSAWLFWGGLTLAVLIPFFINRPFPTAGRFVLGGAIFSAGAGLAYLLSSTNCWQTWMGSTDCISGTATVLWKIAGSAGLLNAGLLIVGIATSRALTKRLLFGACVPLAALMLSPLLLSIGVFLIVGAWAWLGWLIAKAPTLRADAVSHAT